MSTNNNTNENNTKSNLLDNNAFSILHKTMGDWNNYGDETGFYTGNCMNNSPYKPASDSEDYWYVINICMFIGYYSTQIAINAFKKDTYIRNKIDTKWTEWTKLGNGCDADTVDGKHAFDFADKIHNHTISQISDFPVSLPANGGSADNLKCPFFEGDLNNFKNIYSPIGIPDKSKVQNIPPQAYETGSRSYASVINIGTEPYSFNQYYTIRSGKTYMRTYISWFEPQWGNWIDTSEADGGSADNLKCPDFEGDLNNFKNIYSPIRIYDKSKVQNIPPQASETGSRSTANVINIGIDQYSFNQYYTIRSGKTYMRTYINWFEPQWSEWTNIADGGNANTINGKYASDFASLEDINKLKSEIKIIKDFIQLK